jgi:hypothetical protein
MAEYNFKKEAKLYLVSNIPEDLTDRIADNTASAWTAHGSNTVIDDGVNGVKCTGVNDTRGMRFDLGSTGSITNGDLNPYTTYKILLSAWGSGTGSHKVRIVYGSDRLIDIDITNTETPYETIVLTLAGVAPEDTYIELVNVESGDEVWIKELEMFETQGQHKIEMSNINFNQTFLENSFPRKTLHTPTDMFEGSTITTANPANFEIETPIFFESTNAILLDLLFNYDSSGSNLKNFDLYVKTNQDVFKIERALLSNGAFKIEKFSHISVNLSGTAAKVSKVGSASTYVIPGDSPIAESTTFVIVRELAIYLDSIALDKDVVSVSVELQNNVDWVPYRVLHSSLSVTDSSNTMYPYEYRLKDRVLAGSITRYITDINDQFLQDWRIGVPLKITAGENLQLPSAEGLDFDMPEVTITNRLGSGDVFIQSYDWRLTQSLNSSSNVLLKF